MPAMQNLLLLCHQHLCDEDFADPVVSGLDQATQQGHVETRGVLVTRGGKHVTYAQHAQ